jgi:3-oxoacyl-[acyl-carrier protein] reductase
MIRQRKGSILNITSIGAMRALPTAVHYATSKAAMIGFTKCLSREAGTFGVKVNAIAAGIFDTELAQALPERLLQMHHFWASSGRLGRPEELAEYAGVYGERSKQFYEWEVVIVDGGAIT